MRSDDPVIFTRRTFKNLGVIRDIIYGVAGAFAWALSIRIRSTSWRTALLGSGTRRRCILRAARAAWTSTTRSNMSRTRHKASSKNRKMRTPGRSRRNTRYSRAAGLPIGSGQVEGACKNLVGRRLKQTGARWRIRRLNRMASLCSLLYSDLWDQFWASSA